MKHHGADHCKDMHYLFCTVCTFVSTRLGLAHSSPLSRMYITSALDRVACGSARRWIRAHTRPGEPSYLIALRRPRGPLPRRLVHRARNGESGKTRLQKGVMDGREESRLWHGRVVWEMREWCDSGGRRLSEQSASIGWIYFPRAEAGWGGSPTPAPYNSSPSFCFQGTAQCNGLPHTPTHHLHHPARLVKKTKGNRVWTWFNSQGARVEEPTTHSAVTKVHLICSYVMQSGGNLQTGLAAAEHWQVALHIIDHYVTIVILLTQSIN